MAEAPPGLTLLEDRTGAEPRGLTLLEDRTKPGAISGLQSPESSLLLPPGLLEDQAQTELIDAALSRPPDQRNVALAEGTGRVAKAAKDAVAALFADPLGLSRAEMGPLMSQDEFAPVTFADAFNEIFVQQFATGADLGLRVTAAPFVAGIAAVAQTARELGVEDDDLRRTMRDMIAVATGLLASVGLGGPALGAGAMRAAFRKDARRTILDAGESIPPGSRPEARARMAEALDEGLLIGDRTTGADVPPAPTGGPAAVAAQERISAKISVGARPKGTITVQSVYQDVVDNLNPIREFTKKATGKKKIQDVPTAADPYQLARLTRGTFGKADHFLELGTFDFNTLRDTGPALKAVLAPVETDLVGFRAYAVARRTIELAKRDIKSGINLDDARAVVAEGNGKFGTTFDGLVQYQAETARYLRDSGVLSEEAYTAMLAANRDYVPFFRVMDGGTGGPGGGGQGLQTKNPIKRIKGSERDILDPLESVIKNTYAYTALAEKNAVGRAFVEMAERSGAPELFLTRVKDPVRQIQLQDKEIRKLFDEFVTTSRRTTRRKTETKKTTTGTAETPEGRADQAVRGRVEEALTSRGFSAGEADQMINRLSSAKGDAAETIERLVKETETTTFVPELNIRLPNKAATLFRTFKKPLAKDEIAVYEDGKRIVYKVDPDIAATFQNIDAQTASILVKILAIPAKTLRAGSVLSPDFTARNMLRDQLTATVNVPGYIPVFDFVQGALSITNKGEAYRAWLKGGGANSALVSMDRQYLQENLFKLSQNTGVASRARNVVKSPLQVLRVISELAENATRVGAFQRTLKGQTSKEAIQNAAFVSRESTIDFGRIGAKTRAMNMITAFFNAQVQGLDRTVRAFGSRPVASTVKVGATVTLPSVLLWVANHDDIRYQQLPQWQKDLFWIVPTDNWRPMKAGEVFPAELTRNRNGTFEVNDGTIYRIPKPFELGIIFGSLPERMLELFFGDNPDALKDFEETVFQAFVPSMVPTIAVPVVEQFANRSTFTGGPVVPFSAEQFLPEYRYTDYTTETAKALARVFGAFPGLGRKAKEAPDGSIAGGVARALTSPALVENYIRAWTGGLGRYALQAADEGLRIAGVTPDIPKAAGKLADVPVVRAFVVRYPSASVKPIREFYENFNANAQLKATFKELAKRGDIEGLQRIQTDNPAFIELGDIRRTMSDHVSLIHKVNQNPDITPEEKRQLIDTEYFYLIELAKAGNERLRALESATEN